MDNRLPEIKTPLPGPEAAKVLALDHKYVSPSYTRDYPLVARRGEGMIVEDVDGNRFLDFSAGIAVVSTGHCHPDVVRAIQRQAETLIHMSGTDFYIPLLAELAEKMAQIAPGNFAKRVYFGEFGDGGRGSRDEAGTLSHQAIPLYRLSGQLSRPHLRVTLAHGLEGRAAQRVRSLAAGGLARALSQPLPVRHRPQARRM